MPGHSFVTGEDAEELLHDELARMDALLVGPACAAGKERCCLASDITPELPPVMRSLGGD